MLLDSLFTGINLDINNCQTIYSVILRGNFVNIN